MTAPKCKCRPWVVGQWGHGIDFCPLHAAAAEMRSLVEDALNGTERALDLDADAWGPEEALGFVKRARAALAHARGEEP